MVEQYPPASGDSGPPPVVLVHGHGPNHGDGHSRLVEAQQRHPHIELYVMIGLYRHNLYS